MSTVLAQAQIILTADTARFTQEITNARNLSVNSFDDIQRSAKEMAKVGMMGVVAGATAATTAIAAMTVEQVKLANELAKTAQVANTSVTAIQKYTFAAKAAGIEQDKLGDIFKDVQDKVGDFLSTGGGELQDFFKNVAPQAHLTADALRRLSGPEALQAMYDAMEKAKLSQSEMVFYMEGIADEASSLIPLLRDGGAGFKLWANAAENAGAVMDEKTIRASKELKASTDLLKLSYEGVKNQLTQALIPVLSDLAVKLTNDVTLKDNARKAGDSLATGLKGLALAGLSVVATFDLVGSSLGGFLGMVGQLGNNVDWNSPYAMFQVGKNFWANNQEAAKVGTVAFDDIKSKLSQYKSLAEQIQKLGTTGANATIDSYVKLNEAIDQNNTKLGKTGAQIQEQIQKEKELAKEREKRAKDMADGKYAPVPVNKTVLDHAKQYGYATLEKQYSLPAGLLAAVSMQESRGNPGATSRVGAKGEFQFMPATAARFGIAGQERNTAAAAIAAAKYFASNLRLFGDLDKAIAAYNAGEGNVKSGRYKRFKETTNYVKGVRGYLSFMNGGRAIAGGYDVAGALANDAQNAEQQQREAERQAKEQYDLQMKYVTEFANEKTKLYIEHTNKEKEIGKINDDALRKQLLETETTRYQNKVDFLQLEYDKQTQKANEWQQSEEERIKNNAELERREAALTLTNDAKLRQAKIDAINAQEQEALRQARAGFESEMANITDYSKTEIQRLRDGYQSSLNAIDTNSKYSDAQKSDLRNALAGKFNSDLAILRKPAADAFNGLNAEMSGTSELLNLQNQLDQRLDIIKKAKEAEVITVEQAEKAKAKAEQNYWYASYQLQATQSANIIDSVANMGKIMLGETSSSYKRLFALSQSFVMAQAGLNMYKAISDGWAQGATLPQKLAAAATAGAEMLKIIQAAQQIKMQGFMDGGYTGNIPTNARAGYVHGQEYVFDAPSTKAIGIKNLDRIRKGEGIGGDTNINVNVTVNSDGTSSVESQQQLGKNMGDAMAAVALKVVKGELGQNGMIYKEIRRR